MWWCTCIFACAVYIWGDLTSYIQINHLGTRWLKLTAKMFQKKNVLKKSLTLSVKVFFGATVYLCRCFWNGAALQHYSEHIHISTFQHVISSQLPNNLTHTLTHILTISLTSSTIDQLFCHSEHCSPLPARIMLFDALRLWGIWLSISHFSR